jgi:NAD(P)-dependent dehydrogenase (short-subunit alcohol dehydrogenase family)
MTDKRVTLITGANRGIGRAIAERYAASGYHVIIGARDSAQADLVAEDIHNTGGSAEGLQIDVADAISIAAAAKAIASRHQTLDVLVNNAGINISVEDDILAAKQADIDISMRTNAYGPLELTKAVLPLLKAASAARIVNVSGQLGSISETVNPDSPLGCEKPSR